MTIESTVATLIANAKAGAAEDMRDLERVRARVDWSRDTIEALKAAQAKADQAWLRRVAEIEAQGMDDDEADALPDPAEQADVDAIHEELKAVRDKDLWPRKLYFAQV